MVENLIVNTFNGYNSEQLQFCLMLNIDENLTTATTGHQNRGTRAPTPQIIPTTRYVVNSPTTTAPPASKSRTDTTAKLMTSQQLTTQGMLFMVLTIFKAA